MRFQPVDPCYSPRVRRLARRVLPFIYRGDAVYCLCCGGRFRGFIARYESDVLCPGCLSLRRHRAFARFITKQLAGVEHEISLLHFAPEEGLARILGSMSHVRYVSADIDPRSPASMHFDISAIPFEGASFDVIVCSHVLEHVADDRKAMRELRRVLTPDGSFYSMHPVYLALPTTLEDPTVTDPRERRRLFGQFDHVRKYGRDFVDRLAAAGFDVTVEDCTADLDAAQRAYYGLPKVERVYIARRAAVVAPTGTSGTAGDLTSSPLRLPHR